jgi:hypothetical protein
MTSLAVAGEVELAGLRAYLVRLVALDDRAAVRLQASGQVLGVWGGPPLDVVTLRPVALAAPPADRPAQPADRPAPAPSVDVTVSARRLVEAVESVEPSSTPTVQIPAAVPGPAWVGLLPPRSGWAPLAAVPTAAVHDAVRVAVEGFQRRVELLPADARTPAALQAVADEVWSAPVVATVPLRAAHAAELVGLLGRDGEVAALEAGAWVRLSCAGGSVALRRDGGTGMGLDLGIWSLVASPLGTG